MKKKEKQIEKGRKNGPVQFVKDFKIGMGIIQNKDREREDRNSWLSLGQQSFEKAYGENEPDYSEAVVSEPNPKYKL